MPIQDEKKHDIFVGSLCSVIGTSMFLLMIYLPPVLAEVGFNPLSRSNAIFFFLLIGGGGLVIYGAAKLVNTLILKW